MSNECHGTGQIMDGAGGSFGGRISHTQLKCPACGLKIMILPINPNYEYSISATTADERREAAIQKAKEQSDLELAQKIEEIRARNHY